MVVKLRSSAGIALIWVATVAGVSATAWFAIDQAGRDLTGSEVNALRPPTVSKDDPASTPADLDALATPDEAAWMDERRPFLRY